MNTASIKIGKLDDSLRGCESSVIVCRTTNVNTHTLLHTPLSSSADDE